MIVASQVLGVLLSRRVEFGVVNCPGVDEPAEFLFVDFLKGDKVGAIKVLFVRYRTFAF